MDSQTIENFVIRLGRDDFRKVVSLLLRSVFGLNAINVDGTNDGGVDWRVFKDSGGSTSVAYQDTTQKEQTEAKAIEDAKKAVNRTGATKYFFITSRRISGLKLKKLENKIATDLKIPATCLGAKEIASFIYEANLESEFLDAIDAPLAAGHGKQPESSEILLHSYNNLSDDRFNHQNQVYDDSILLTSKLSGPLKKPDLATKTIELLSCAESRFGPLLKRIDSLLSRRELKQKEDKTLEITPEAASEFENAGRLYLKELSILKTAQCELMEKEFKIEWTAEHTQRSTVYISRIFIKQQLETITSSGAVISAPGLVKNIGDPLEDLKSLLKSINIPPQRINRAVDELLEQAKDSAVIKKLIRAAVYVSLEGVDPISAAKSLGAPRWADITILLDASVVIPYICSRLYRPIGTSFFTISCCAIDQLRRLGCRVVVPSGYINECASHLLRALDYDSLKDFKEDLAYSPNAYVANYYGLLSTGVAVPETIQEYLKTFSSAVVRKQEDKEAWVRTVMVDIQSLLNDYGVDFEFFQTVHEAVRKDIEVEYTYQLNATRTNKVPLLIYHDVDALAHVRMQISQKGEHWIVLTWDKSMITVGQKVSGIGWVVSPEVALDFSQPYNSLPDTKLCSISHRIAQMRDKSHYLSADFIDNIVHHAKDQLQDWQFRARLAAFKEKLLARVDYSTPDYKAWLDAETETFLKSEKINMTAKP